MNLAKQRNIDPVDQVVIVLIAARRYAGSRYECQEKPVTSEDRGAKQSLEAPGLADYQNPHEIGNRDRLQSAAQFDQVRRTDQSRFAE